MKDVSDFTTVKSKVIKPKYILYMTFLLKTFFMSVTHPSRHYIIYIKTFVILLHESLKKNMFAVISLFCSIFVCLFATRYSDKCWLYHAVHVFCHCWSIQRLIIVASAISFIC